MFFNQYTRRKWRRKFFNWIEVGQTRYINNKYQRARPYSWKMHWNNEREFNIVLTSQI
jgi:hypothetical protein